MDAVRERLNEQKKHSRKKLWIGLIAIIILIVGIIWIEGAIDSNLTDVTIKKSDIKENEATFTKLKELDTNIIAVKTSDGEYKLAFDDCEGCYREYGKHSGYRISDDNTGIVCKKCGHSVAYEEMGFVTEECSPVYILVPDIVENSDSFVLPVEYLEKKKSELEAKRNGQVMNAE